MADAHADLAAPILRAAADLNTTVPSVQNVSDQPMAAVGLLAA